ncbi:MAG: 3-oxoacyl-[acyl-carrier-protein] reductase [Peptococcaceae bacterium]|nr:3-oxoacyl-[acyl-carrier-protein] reductase [Peptococcaceae bacterium]
MSVKGKVALVTGGSRGIGRAICLELAGQGAEVIINYSGNRQAAEDTAAACRALGAKALILQADVAKAKDCKTLFDQAVAFSGRVDLLVNNAGITRDGLLIRMSEEDYDQVLDTNLKGAFLCAREAARLMMKQRFGRIVNMSSVVGLRGNAGQANYAASKAGIIGLTKALARELAGRNITVNAVAPGFIETDMTAVLPENVRTAILAGIPLGRLGRAEEAARAAVFFLQEENGYLTGQVLAVDGGMAM